MLIDPAPKYRKRKPRGGKPANTPPGPTPLAVASVDVGDFDGPSGHLSVIFDVAAGQSLVDPQNADPAKWTAVFNGTLYLGSEFAFDGGAALTIFFTDYGSDAGANRLNYAADPSDIEDSQGRMLAAFENFPLQG